MTVSFTERAFRLLDELERENTSQWFSRHREEFRAELTDPMVELLATVTDRLAASAWPLAGGRRTMMRQNRDTRFATTPYHVTVRGLLSRHGGPLAVGEAGAHIELGADGGFVGVGLHRPSAAVLRPIRHRLLDGADAFARVMSELSGAGLELVEDRVATMPQGFSASAHHPMADHVRQRSLTVVRPIARREWETGAVVDEIDRVIRSSAGLLAFLHPRK